MFLKQSPPDMASELDAYRDHVRHAIAARTGKPMMNGSLEHSAILLQESMRAAQHEMLILSSRLDDACFGQRAVRHAAQVFLADPEKRMRILVETALWDPQENFRWGQNPFVQDIAANVGLGQVEIASVKKDWIAGYRFNFFVVDRFGFRYQEDRDEPAAIAAFYPSDREIGPKDTVMHLRGIFAQLWRHSNRVELEANLPVAANA
jgi:hypothetical protein